MKAVSTFLGIFITGLLYGQITFTQSDFPKPGIIINYLEGWSDSVDMGAAGANQIFDFTKVLSAVEDTFELEFEDPSSTPYAANHPNATVAFLSEIEEDSITGQIVLELWDFIQVTSTESKYVGITANIDTGYLFSQSAPTSMIAVHSNYAPSFENIGTNWTFNKKLTTNSNWSVNLGVLKHDENIVQNIDIDAWGTFKNPWRSFNAIRFKVEEYNSGTDTINGQQDDAWVDTSYYFEYWVNGLGNYIARVYTDSTYTDIYDFEIADQKNPVGIEKIHAETWVSVYPQPGKDILYVKMDFTGNVNFEINDLNGREVLNGRFSARNGNQHEVDVRELKKGMYILNLYSEGKVLARKKIMIE